MAENWMTPDEAMRFLGIASKDELERLVLKNDADVDVDVDGELTMVDADDLREVLYKEHERKVGHRPDDVGKRIEAKQRGKINRQARARARKGRRERLVQRRKAEGKR
jgi:hypothetical protein